jgi:hypothetical protein
LGEVGGIDALAERAGEAVQLPDEDDIAGVFPRAVQRSLPLGSIALSAGRFLDEDLLAAGHVSSGALPKLEGEPPTRICRLAH